MCGIAAMVGGRVEPRALDAMTDALAHRGPDGRGTWIDAGRQVGLGHRRLAIQDLSAAALQPMADASGKLQIIFNGEIYNFVELRERLGDYPFRTRSDTEVILAAYRRWGRRCVEHFNGMFAFALWDEETGELFCARDRLGVKPLFYASRNGQLLLASEVKALLAAGISPVPDMAAWARYLVHGAYEDQDGSFFSAVAALPPGHSMAVRPDGSVRIERYWDLAERAGSALELSEPEAADQLDALLDDATRLRLRSDVPVALNLSGGIDSSAVAQAFLRQLASSGTVHIFSACFDDPRYDEDVYADKVMAGYQCARHRVRLSPSEVPAMAAEAMHAQEAPYGGIGTLSYHSLHRQIARDGLKVALEGQGGDELFAGYAYFAPLHLLDEIERGSCASVRQLASAYPEPSQLIGLARRTRHGAASLYQDGSDFLAPDCNVAGIMAQATVPVYPEPFSSRLSNALFRDLTCTKLPRVLRMNDRLAMAFGIELRQPFLDYRLVEFAFRLPSSLKIANGLGKYVLRAAMNRHLPNEIVWSPKRPVVTPQREWVSGPLKEWIGDVIHSRRFAERGLFDLAAVHRTFSKFLGGELNNAFPIWQWLNTDLWYRCFVEGRNWAAPGIGPDARPV